MAIIPQPSLFVWSEVEELGDLKRLQLVIETMPDESLMQKLEKRRKNGRDDYPIRGMWNSLLAGIVFQHPSIESLRRELSRNAQLRMVCGLTKVPTSSAYSRFMVLLLKEEKAIHEMFVRLVEEISEELPEFGKHLAMDSKAIASFATRKNRRQKRDGRRDVDADYGKKVYRGKKEDGTPWEKIVRWFGYKLHLIVDAIHELPVFYSVTKASTPDVVEGRRMWKDMKETMPKRIEEAETCLADKGYDDTKLIEELWEEYGVKPVIDIRNMWKDGEATKVVSGQTNVVYNYKGTVYCVCPETGKEREMANGGFEKDRNTLKKLCPAKVYGITCKGQKQCPVGKGIRIRLEEDRRVFTPIDRSSRKWETLYAKRTAVERVNSRLDVSFGMEQHTIRGLSKMRVRCGMVLGVMLALALGRIREKKEDKMRSLVCAA